MKQCPFSQKQCIGNDCQLWDNLGSIKDCSLSRRTEQKIPKAQLLILEKDCFEDLDENLLVYGLHFKFDLSDAAVPPLIKTIQKMPGFNQNLRIYTWQEYLQTVN